MTTLTMQPHNPGLVIHHDIRNEGWLLDDKLPRLAKVRKAEPTIFVPKTRKHRQRRRYNQGPTPKCTGYGSATLCATADPFNVPPITPDEWYDRNVAFDRANGRFYDEGATVTAAMEVGRELGIFTAYRWAYTIETMQRAILTGALIAGTYWYDSMFERTELKPGPGAVLQGIVKLPGPNERTDAGHLYTIRGYIKERGLWIIPNTWDDGEYLIPDELMHRLLREEGEVSRPDEIKLPRAA